MNSLSNGNCSGTAGAANCRGICPPGYIQCTSPAVDLHPAPGQALLQCGTGSTPQIPASFPPATNPLATIPLAQVEIDTTCLCFPNIKIEFSSLIEITTPTAGTTVGSTITVQLSRLCDNNIINKTILKTTTIVLTPALFVGTVDYPYSFIYCSQNVPSRDCTYIVEITNSSLVTTTTALVKEAQIAAYAVGGQRLC